MHYKSHIIIGSVKSIHYELIIVIYEFHEGHDVNDYGLISLSSLVLTDSSLSSSWVLQIWTQRCCVRHIFFDVRNILIQKASSQDAGFIILMVMTYWQHFGLSIYHMGCLILES